MVGLALLVAACDTGDGATAAGGTGASNGSGAAGSGGGTGGSPGAAVWSEPNEYSWDGSWTPESFPIPGLLDETHPTLPPGKWGWDGSCDCPGDEGLAIYNNEFVEKGLDFLRLEDSAGHLFGWRLIDTDGGDTSLNHRGDNYDGTPGVDIFDLGLAGMLQGTGPGDETPGINLGDGPDMLRYGVGWSVDMRVGDGVRGGAFDNDLVILGTEDVLPLNTYDIQGTTVHTGPGSDLVFVRNFGPAAIDLGNGLSGRTDAIDPSDGGDMVVLQGNMRDFRIFGGNGDDVFVWYVDEVVDDRWLGPSFYGGGGWGDALWASAGTDRLVLVVDPATEVVVQRGQHDNNPGSLLAMVYSDYGPTIDGPTENDPFARYYGSAPVGPADQHTITFSYRSADETVFTHDFFATSVEEIQLGLGTEALVYDVDQVTGALTASEAEPLLQAPDRAAYNNLFETFAK